MNIKTFIIAASLITAYGVYLTCNAVTPIIKKCSNCGSGCPSCKKPSCPK